MLVRTFAKVVVFWVKNKLLKAIRINDINSGNVTQLSPKHLFLFCQASAPATNPLKKFKKLQIILMTPTLPLLIFLMLIHLRSCCNSFSYQKITQIAFKNSIKSSNSGLYRVSKTILYSSNLELLLQKVSYKVLSFYKLLIYTAVN